MSASRDAFPQIDLSDLSPVQARSLFMVPFLGNGFTASGIYVRMGGGTGECPNCYNDELERSTGLGFTLEGTWGECWRCNGSGREKFGEIYPVLGRVLSVNPKCEDVKVGDVIVFLPNNYDWVHLSDGRSFCNMPESAALAILEGFDDGEVTLVA